MVAMRLLWVLEHVPGLREAADRGEAMFGCVDTCTVLHCTVLYCTVLYSTVLYCRCVDTWLLYKLTGKHVTEGQC